MQSQGQGKAKAEKELALRPNPNPKIIAQSRQADIHRVCQNKIPQHENHDICVV